MRMSVLVLDLLVFFPSVWAMSLLLTTTRGKTKATTSAIIPALLTLTVLLQPSLITIDYGHFQVVVVRLLPSLP